MKLQILPNAFNIKMKLFIFALFYITILALFFSCSIIDPPEPTGACVYGPQGLKACVNGVTREDCLENFHGSWHEGQRCP